MPVLAQYRLTDGMIHGVWSAAVVAHLDAQIPAVDTENGYLRLDDYDPLVLQEQYRVVKGSLEAKPQVTLTAVPSTFPADGTTVCTISVTPFVPCAVFVGQTLMVLTEEDRTVQLTADAPMLLTVSLPQQAACWGQPLTVEAV